MTEPIINKKTITKDNTKFMATICAACNYGDDASTYNENITPNYIASLQEWKFIVDYASRERRVLNINTVGESVVVFDHMDVVPSGFKVTKVQPIVTCKEHQFYVHKLPYGSSHTVSLRNAPTESGGEEYVGV